ncbi:MAG: DHH family phosphoesterase [Oscillospiraceae bacterium]|nr:DHH family phosphoesterase [Oscillospiraceae bacterium]
MKNKFLRYIRPSGRLYFIVLVAFTATVLLFGYYLLAAAFAAALILLTVYRSVYAANLRHKTERHAENILYAANDSGRGALNVLPMPTIAFTLSDGRILWANESFYSLIGDREHFFDISVTEILPRLDYKWLVNGGSESPEPYKYDSRYFRLRGSALSSNVDYNSDWGIIYWEEITDYLTLKDEYALSRLVIIIVELDNYDELFKGMSDVEKSALLAELESKINDWLKLTNGFIARIDRGRYACLVEERWLHLLTESKFSILEKVRELKNPAGVNGTVCVGIGKGGDSPSECFKFAALAIEMAMSRGGDQAVIKDKLTFSFFGGKREDVERNTKVKSRVMATALNELMLDASGVIVMGHKFADFDCLGAAAGIVALARRIDKKCNIVLNPDTNLAMSIVKRLRSLDEYNGVFITVQDAMLSADSKTLLIVTDTSRPEQVESEALLESCTRIAVIDHHRRAIDYITNAIFNFHEPFSSSASELVTDILQYLAQPRDLLKQEAEAVLAGIVLDTKSFNIKTGSRTFEAAAFLRKSGADTAEVRRLFQLDLDHSALKADIIRNAKMVNKHCAIAEMRGEGDRVIAAQAADELLNVQDVKASFVIFEIDGERCVSARSSGDINVQLIMEALGGGGNSQAAAMKTTALTIAELRQALIDAINKY